MSFQSRYRFTAAWLPDGWRRNVVISVDPSGDIVDVSPDDVVTTARLVNGVAIPGHAECTQSRVPALDGGAGGAAHRSQRQGRQLLDLARDHVRARRPHVARVPECGRGAMLCGHAQGRLYGRVRVSLPAQSARRHAVRGPRRDVPGTDRCCDHARASASRCCRRCTRPAISAAPSRCRASDSSCSRRTSISTSSTGCCRRTRNRRKSRSASRCTACAPYRRMHCEPC